MNWSERRTGNERRRASSRRRPWLLELERDRELINDGDEHSVHVDALEARRQDHVDRLSSTPAPEWDGAA